MDISKEMNVLRGALERDPGYRMAWQANIAMAFVDEWQRTASDGGLPATVEQIHAIANRAANYFLEQLERD